jgi:hypothetical protein
VTPGVRDALLTLGPFSVHWILVLVIRRFRIGPAPLLEPWTRIVDPRNYRPEGRKLIPWLYASASLFGLGVLIVIVLS